MVIQKGFPVAASLFMLIGGLFAPEQIPGVNVLSPAYSQSPDDGETFSYRGRSVAGDGVTVVHYQWPVNHPGGKVFRKFSDANGVHLFDASLDKFDVENASVYLSTKHGNKVMLAIAKLSEVDRMWVINEQKRRLFWSWRAPGEKYPVHKVLKAKVEIDDERKDAAIASFGAPHRWRNRVEADSDGNWEKAKQFVAMRKDLAGRGMDYSIIEDRPRPNYHWMINQSRDDLKSLARTLNQLGKKEGLLTRRDYIRLFASFVQHMRYEIPQSNYEHADYGMVYTSGVWMPLESLYRGCGDCDTKSVLFASLLANIANSHVVFMLGEGHAFVGVRGVPRRGDRVVNLRGAKYILVELTAPWPVGQIPSESWHHTQRGALEVVKVVGEEK